MSFYDARFDPYTDDGEPPESRVDPGPEQGPECGCHPLNRGTGTCPINGHDHNLTLVRWVAPPPADEVLWECPDGGGRWLEVPTR